MTGPGEGKFLLENCKVYLKNKERKEIVAKVYIHLKGYSLARVTHLDIESNVLNKLIKPKGGFFYSIHGIDDGIEIKFRDKSLLVLHQHLTKVLAKGEKTRTWIGGKIGGIYIGFRKAQVAKLEKIIEEEFKFQLNTISTKSTHGDL